METRAVRTIRTRYGMFAVDAVSDEKMARALAGESYPNEELLIVARACTDAKSVVVDIGAHIGTFAVPIARNVKSVIAYEASPKAAALLSRNASENNVPLRVINKALGKERGSGTLRIRNASNAGANAIVPGGDIPITTLDDEAIRADFIKVDVEGMELEVLAGAGRLIRESRPTILFEVNISQLRAQGASVAALARFFRTRRYRLFFPIFGHGATLSTVRLPSLLAALIAPRAWFFYAESAPFDLLAVPEEKPPPLPQTSFPHALGYVVSQNVAVKYKRLRRFFRSIL